MKLKVIIILVLAILLVIFALQNTEVVITKLWFWEIKSPRAVLILSSILAGVILGIASSAERIKKKSKQKGSDSKKE